MGTILYKVLLALILIILIVQRIEFPRISLPPEHSNCVNRRKLIGPLQVNPSPPPLSQQHYKVQMGGYFVPDCSHSQNVAIIVPCHNRQSNLESLIYHLHPMLQRQELEYQIFVIDQVGDEIFNKATVMNVGFMEALKIRNFSCFIFHDVDLIPENDENIYDCPPPHSTRHLSVSVDTMNYTLPYENIFGGVVALTREQFMTVNGFSNRFYGWGGEDDDLWRRVTFHGFKVIRPDPRVARYKMLDHQQLTGKIVNLYRYDLVNYGRGYYGTDGLSDLNRTVKQVQVNLHPFYTFITARIVRPRVPWRRKTVRKKIPYFRFHQTSDNAFTNVA